MTTIDSPHLLALASETVARSVAAKSRLGRLLPAVVELAEEVQRSLAAGGKLVLFGNGGSAADAQHIAAELVGRFVRERPAWPALALTTDTSALTAIANDFGYDEVFRRQVEGLVKAGDVVVGISTSGNSPSVVNGLEAARSNGAVTVAFTGGRRSRCDDFADYVLAVPETETARIQECHLLLGHLLCELLDAQGGSTAVGKDSDTEFTVSNQLRELRSKWSESGLRVVLTNGVFDLLHVGHLRSLESARALGDVLLVAINSDETVARLKGAGRPVVPATQRAQLVAALGVVDHVVIFDEPDATSVIAALRPDIWCKGADYADRERSTIPEVAVIESYGGEVAFVEYVPDLSTSALIDKARG